ncbi:phage tail-collar fiber domain-containing protein [Gilvimarinus japonicus]|uniref:Phage tail protein n=1 Tax=Gilvimarinus japonicus TaxID=1796469 RepID=A0ABV7HR16_9GAMM
MQAITLNGESLIAQAKANNTALSLDRFVLAYIPGLDHTQAVNRSQGLPAAQYIVHEAPIHAAGYIVHNKVVYSLVLDTTIGDFEFNWLGLVYSDDSVFFVSELFPVSKTKTVGNIQGDSLTRNVILQFNDAQNTMGITVPAEAWQTDFSQTFQRVWKWAPDGYTAVNCDHLIPDNLAGPMELKLPPNPDGKTVVTLGVSEADYSVAPVYVRRNGKTIMGQDQDVVDNGGQYQHQYRYSTHLNTWIISRTGVKGQLPL